MDSRPYMRTRLIDCFEAETRGSPPQPSPYGPGGRPWERPDAAALGLRCAINRAEMIYGKAITLESSASFANFHLGQALG
jgi:hypothetical protein